MCFYMVIHMVTTQGKTKEEMDWCRYGHLAVRGHLPHCGQDIIEEHCSAYRLPMRSVSIVSISLGVLSLQSSKWSEKSRYTETRKPGKSGKGMVSSVCMKAPSDEIYDKSMQETLGLQLCRYLHSFSRCWLPNLRNPACEILMHLARK